MRPPGPAPRRAAAVWATVWAAVRVLIADDEWMLRTIMESAPDITVVGEAGDGAEAVTMAQTPHPDVVLMDIRI